VIWVCNESVDEPRHFGGAAEVVGVEELHHRLIRQDRVLVLEQRAGERVHVTQRERLVEGDHQVRRGIENCGLRGSLH